jgi:hypothetical protein
MTLGPSSTSEEIVAHLESMRDRANIRGTGGRFGIETGTAIGISSHRGVVDAEEQDLACTRQRHEARHRAAGNQIGEQR